MKILIDRLAEVKYTNTSRNTSARIKDREQVLASTGQYFCIGYDRFGKDKGVELYAVKNKNISSKAGAD